MNKKGRILAGALALCCASAGLSACGAKQQTLKIVNDNSKDVQYIIMELTNVKAASLEGYVREFDSLYGANDLSSDRLIGFGVAGPLILNMSVAEIKDTIDTAFYIAEKYNRPVYFQMDDMTAYTEAFGSGTETKYWEDPSMCEWVDFPGVYEEWGGSSNGSLPKWWFNWGNWMCNYANPCLNSESFLELLKWKYDNAVLPAMVSNYQKLLDAGKGSLFAGVCVGWETHIPDNETTVPGPSLPVYEAAKITMQEFEHTQYGYHALHNLGYTQKDLKILADEQLTTVRGVVTDILMDVIHDFIEYTCKCFYDAGIKKEKVFSHIVGCASSGKRVRTTAWPDIYTAVNDYSTPGFTLHMASKYNRSSFDNCEFNMENIMSVIGENIPGYKEYAIAEGYASGYDEYLDDSGKVLRGQELADYQGVVTNVAELYLNDMFRVTDKQDNVIGAARIITCFGYDSSREKNPAYGINRTHDGAFVTACRKWKDRELLTDFDWQAYLSEMRDAMAQRSTL